MCDSEAQPAGGGWASAAGSAAKPAEDVVVVKDVVVVEDVKESPASPAEDGVYRDAAGASAARNQDSSVGGARARCTNCISVSNRPSA